MNRTMKTIINKHLSSMLDALLQKALEEKPIKSLDNGVTLLYKNGLLITKEYGLVFHSKNKWDNSYNGYPLDFTEEQREITDKIFQKWGNHE